MADDIGNRIKQYVQIRDKIKELEKQHSERVAPLIEIQNLLSGAILRFLEGSGNQKVTSATGETAYISMRTTAALDDPDAFMNFVIANQTFDLLDRRANATAVQGYMEKHQVQPPGVHLNTMKTIGVRRSTKADAA